MSSRAAVDLGPEGERRGEFLALLAAAAAFAAVAGSSGMFVAPRLATGEAGLIEAVHLAALVVFALAFFPVAGPWSSARIARAARSALVVTALAAATAVATLPQIGLTPVLFILTAVLAGHLLSPRASGALIAGQTLVVLLTALGAFGETFPALLQTLGYGGFQLFALTITMALLAERSLRQHLALANAELSGARALLETTSRQGERLRIARELHDLVGHHLTALALQLEVADHLAEGRAREPVARARVIARLLLADVRGVVSDLREREFDLTAVLGAMVAELPRPRVTLDLPETLEVDDTERARVVLRLVQEALTNAVRHGDAKRAWITLRRQDGMLLIEARDDGRGTHVIVPGSGLRGMRERVAAVGGELQFESAPEQGFTVRARFPLPGSDA